MTGYIEVVQKLTNTWVEKHMAQKTRLKAYLAVVLAAGFRAAYNAGHADGVTGRPKRSTKGVRQGFRSIERSF